MLIGGQKPLSEWTGSPKTLILHCSSQYERVSAGKMAAAHVHETKRSS